MSTADQPILVLGVGRGGTSILTACLSGHPCIAMQSEFATAAYLMGQEFAISSTASLIDDRLRKFRTACEEDALRHPGKIWGNKVTTEQIMGLEEHNSFNDVHVDVVERFLEIMNGYRIVFITRHGAACVDSKVRRTGQPMVQAALRWCYGARLLGRLTKSAAVTHQCRYEDLVTDPRTTLLELSEALALDFDESMLEQTSSDILIQDYRHGRFLSEKAQDIPELPTEIVTLIRPWLEQLGY